MPNRLIDLSNRRFGRLLVIERVNSDNPKVPMWLCKCDCGNTKVISGAHLRNGTAKSCGCIRKEHGRAVGLVYGKQLDNRTHGMKGTRLYNIWQGMKARCLNSNDPAYPRYGGRGISICYEWQTSFESFRDWALANGYSDTLTIDRINNNGDYAPSNCRWVTPKEQANNRRNNHFVTYNGQTKTVSQWAEECGLHKDVLLHRLNANWDIEKALTTPSQRK